MTALSPGTYEIQVAQKGFATFKQKATISPGLHGVVDVAMSPQAQGETVEVTADVATQVDTQTSSINQVVGQTQIASLPSLTRDPYDFVQTLGNVNQDSAAGNGGQDMVPRGTVSPSTDSVRLALMRCWTAEKTSTSTPRRLGSLFRSRPCRSSASPVITFLLSMAGHRAA